MLSYTDEIALQSMQGLIRFPYGPTVFGFHGEKIKVTVLLTGEDLDGALAIAGMLVKAARCNGMVYVFNLDTGLSDPRQVVGHAFALGEHVSWIMAYSIDDDGHARMVQPYKLEAVAPAVEIIELALGSEVEAHHLDTAQMWLKRRGHSVLLA